MTLPGHTGGIKEINDGQTKILKHRPKSTGCLQNKEWTEYRKPREKNLKIQQTTTPKSQRVWHTVYALLFISGLIHDITAWKYVVIYI